MTNEQMKEFLQSIISKTPFASLMGARVVSISPGSVELAIDVKPEIMNQHHGFVHGAIIGFVADSACAWAAGSVAGDVVTSEYKLNLLAPAIGDRIIGRGKVVKSSSKSVVALAEVYSVKSEKEKLVGVALATIAKVEQTSL
jgi:uncharacterized protein (TIGR00369 family)